MLNKAVVDVLMSCVVVYLRLPDLLLYPVRRIQDYVQLLSWYQVYLPRDHADRRDLDLALRSLRETAQLIIEVSHRDRSVIEIGQL